MFEEFGKKEKRLEELEQLLSGPNIASKGELFRTYAKEHSELVKLVTKYREYKKIEKEIEELENDLSSRHDPDFAELAEPEISELKKKRDFTN